ncbi:OsmC family protein [Candidatus Omnitrophota bacterium]
MKVQIKYQEGSRFIAQAREHQLTIDQPKEKGGSDSGMNPSEVFLSSLGSCIAFYARKYCKDTNVDPSGLVVDVESELSQDRPFRFKDVNVKIHLGQDLDNRRESLIKFVSNCPIHNTITSHPNIKITV